MMPVAGALGVALHVDDAGWADAVPGVDAFAERIAVAIARLVEIDERAEADVVLVDDARIADLNLRFRHRDGPTNVLSFAQPAAWPGVENERVFAYLGEVYIARETVLREAGEQGKAPLDHTVHLMVHGLLHLLGYDHDTEQDASQMERAEKTILANLGIGDPYV